MATDGAASVPVPPTTEEEEFDLFGPGPAATAPASSSTPVENPFQSPQQATAKASPAGSPTGVNVNPFAVPPQAAASVPTAGSTPGPQPSQGEEFQSIMLEMLRQQNQSTMELLRQQSLAMQQNQQMVAAMLRRMDLEEERRTKAEEKVVEAAEAARKAAETALTRDPFDPKEAASAKASPSVPFTTSYGGSNRAEKYLPPLPVIDHQGMGKGRMKEVETWHAFMETLSSWLALQEEAFVRELQLCIPVKTEIEQVILNPETAARSAKLFYYLKQSLSKWERGLEIIRSCSKRQGQSTCGYEVVRTITSQYSIVSRMEAVFVRDHCLKLHTGCKHLRNPTDIIRHLEDEFSRAEAKLTNFTELKLSEADRCSVLLQALSSEVRQYVVLHGSSSDWASLKKSLTYYEEQLRLCEIPSNNRAIKTDVLCEHCGKKGHAKKDCWKWKREQREQESGKGKGAGEESSGKGNGGKDTPKGKGDHPKGKSDKGKDKGKGQDGKNKKKKKGGGKSRAMAGEESEPESEAGSGAKSHSVMALRLGSWTFAKPDRALSPLGGREGTAEKSEKNEGSVSPSGKGGYHHLPAASKYEAARICSQHGVDPRDLWLVDSGATCHVVAREFLSSFRVVKQHSQKPVLYNASSDEIPVHGLVDLEIQFGVLNIVLEEVVVADVAFNAVSPWSACERGWRTHLFKSGARMFRGKRSVRLLAANRAWWAVSGQPLKAKKPKKAADDMELDSASVASLSSGASVSGLLSAGAQEDEEVKEEAGTLASEVPLKAPPGLEETAVARKGPKKKASFQKLAVSDTPFAYLVRALRTSPDLGCLEEEQPRTQQQQPQQQKPQQQQPQHACNHVFFMILLGMIFLTLLGSLVGSCACRLVGVLACFEKCCLLVAELMSCLIVVALGRLSLRKLAVALIFSLGLGVNAASSVELLTRANASLSLFSESSIAVGSVVILPDGRVGRRQLGTAVALFECYGGGEPSQYSGDFSESCAKVAVFPTARQTTRRFEGILVPKGHPTGPNPTRFAAEHLEGSKRVCEHAKVAVLPSSRQTTRRFEGILVPKGQRSRGQDLRFPQGSSETNAKSSVRCGGLRLLRVLLRVLSYVFRALLCLWNMSTIYFFEAVFLGIFGGCSGLLLPGVLWLRWARRFRKPRIKRRRCRRLPREPHLRIKLQGCWRRFPGMFCPRLCLVASVLLGRSAVFGSLGSMCSGGCRVEHVVHDVCRVRVLLGPSVALLRGLPVVIDVEGAETEELQAPSAPDAPDDEEKEGGQEEALERPTDPKDNEASSLDLSSRALRDHQSQGHQPYVANCDACLCARGRCPARRIKDPQKMSSAIGMDYLYFGKLRVLLMMHEMSRYTLAIPAQEDAKDDPRIVESVGNMIREIGLQNRVITFRCDNENLLLAFGNHLASKSKQLGVERVIVDPVPGYRPQAKGGVEKQVSVVKQAFWSNWLGMESEISRKGHEEEPLRLPLGGRLWSMCLLYVSRTINLFLCSPGDVATPLDLVHDEICSRPRTLPFGSLCACQVAGPRLTKKYRGRKLIRCIYLGPIRARGGGVLAIPVGSSGSKEVEVFPACRGILDNDRFVFLKDELQGIAGDDVSILDVSDPERPINFVPKDRKRSLPEEDMEAEDGEEELIPDKPAGGSGPGYDPELGYDPDRGFRGPETDSEYAPSEADPAGVGDMELDEDGDARMEEEEIEAKMIDLLVHESLMGIYRGPDLRTVGRGKSRSFEVPFCGSKILCVVPDNAVSETTGEKLDPELLEKAMRLELEELESFRVGTVVSEEQAKRLARTNGRRVLR